VALIAYYAQGTSYTTSETDCSTAFFVFGGCRTNSTTFASSTTYSSEIGNDNVSQRYWTSGTALYDSFNRTTWASSVEFYAPYGSAQHPAQQYKAIGPDWLTPSTASAHGGYLLKEWGASIGGSPEQGMLVTYGTPAGGEVTTSTTNATTGVKEIAISVDVGLVGGGGIGVADLSWSQTSSETKANTLSWTAQVPEETEAPACFLVYGQGGSETLNTADVIGIWVYAPAYSNGQYSCPIP
jgi:hypothetical protein